MKALVALLGDDLLCAIIDPLGEEVLLPEVLLADSFDGDDEELCVIVDPPGEEVFCPEAVLPDDSTEDAVLLGVLLLCVIVEPPGEELGDVDLVLVDALLVTVDEVDVVLGVEDAVVPLVVVEVGDLVVVLDVDLLAFSASSIPMSGHRYL